MPDVDLIKQGKQETDRDARGRFVKGLSGNPAGRPQGCVDYATRAARLLLAGEGEILLRRAIDMALGGDSAALRLCVERILGPCRERTVEFALPPIGQAGDLARAMAAIADAVSRGLLTPREAMQLSRLFDAYVRAMEATEFEDRISALEAAAAAADVAEGINATSA